MNACKKSSITKEYIRSILNYDPSTGTWVWIKRRSGVTVGMKAGTPNAEKRIQIRIDGIKYYSSNLAWIYMTGKWPKECVDHINRVCSDDRWDNLREVTRSQNSVNCIRKKKKHHNLPIGVTIHPGGYQAKISINGKRKFLGLFDTPEKASQAYIKASEFRKEFLPRIDYGNKNM